MIIIIPTIKYGSTCYNTCTMEIVVTSMVIFCGVVTTEASVGTNGPLVMNTVPFFGRVPELKT